MRGAWSLSGYKNQTLENTFPFGKSLCFPAEISNLVLLPLLFCSPIPSLPFAHSTYLSDKMEEQSGEGRKKLTQYFTTRDLLSISIQVFAYICLLAILPHFSLLQIKKITYRDLSCVSLSVWLHYLLTAIQENQI